MNNFKPPISIPRLTPEQRVQRRIMEIDPSYTNLLISIIGEANDLIVALRSDREADYTQTRYTFEAESAEGAMLPESIKDVLRKRTLRSVDITMTHEADARTALTFEFNNTDGSMVYVSRSDDPSGPHIPDSFYAESFVDETESPFPRIPDVELSRLMVSLIYNGDLETLKEFEPSLLENHDLQHPELYSMMRDAFADCADESLISEVHSISDPEDELPMAEVSYVIENDELSSMRILQTRISNDYDIVTNINLESGSPMKITFHAIMQDSSEMTPLPARSEDIIEIRRFLSQLVRLSKPVVVSQQDMDFVDDPGSSGFSDF